MDFLPFKHTVHLSADSILYHLFLWTVCLGYWIFSFILYDSNKGMEAFVPSSDYFFLDVMNMFEFMLLY